MFSWIILLLIGTIAYRIGHGKTANFGTPFNTPAGYVTLVNSNSYAIDARFCGATMSVRTFPMMHMGFSIATDSTINARLRQRIRPNAAAQSRVMNFAGNFDAVRSDFFTRKSENAQATEPCSSIRGTFVANDTGGHAFG